MSMDIIRGKLDGISKPASSSRSCPGSRSSTASLEVLPPEPGSFKIDMLNQLNSGTEGHSSNSGMERRRSSNYEKWAQYFRNTKSANESSHEDPGLAHRQLFPEHPADLKLEKLDAQLQSAIQKMHKFDKILAKRQYREKEVKKQGVEMRQKLWEGLKSAKNTEDLESDEELENTKKFLCLTSKSAGASDVEPVRCEFEDTLFSVFHTQIPIETYENHTKNVKKDFTCDVEKIEPLVKTERNTERIEPRSKHSQDFIKRNIELAKNSRSPVVMIDREKKRLDELLRGLDDTDSGLSSSEGDQCGWLVPGEGYTLADTESQQLAEIDTKLQEFSVVSPTVFSLSPRLESQSNKEPDPEEEEKTTEPILGEKILRDNKKQRDQQSRLRAIDGELRELNEQLDSTLRLSEERLKCLLEECVSQQKRIRLALSSEAQNEDIEIALEPPQLCPSTLCELLEESKARDKRPQPDYANGPEEEGCASPSGFYLTKALAGHYNPEALLIEIETMKGLQFSEAFSDAADYYMSKTIGVGRLKKPPFLDDLLDDIYVNFSDDQLLKLSRPEKSLADEQQPEDAVDE
ncbi:fibrous sheath-interacting protein 1 isoform X1 [Meriones unguiculatus]|uniref:fibrous sheath-interacting protein 1 isoform X1 n=1 Tax=Meriones unguiculatus TaxID=10047 RepID=UPI00293E04E1|nr:fibrous sheath-interacting protein 1 isoform X1 [Meriones unguiculatus]XP_060227496.1 fibrous sheath-interacting protein 1 isoform X1 [Meriones unguiculatus]